MVPIRRLLLKDLLVLAATVVAVVCGMAWYSLNRVVEQEALEKGRLGITRIQGDLHEHFDRMESLGRALEALWTSGTLDEAHPESVDQILHPLLKNTPQVATLAFWGPQGKGFMIVRNGRNQSHTSSWSTQLWEMQGEVCMGRWIRRGDVPVVPLEAWVPVGMNPADRPWYRATLIRGRSGWVEPYSFFPDMEPGLSYGVPIRGTGGTLRGVVLLDLILDDLASQVWTVQPTPQTEAYIADALGRLLIGPRERPETGGNARLQAFLRPLSEEFLPLGYQVLRNSPGPMLPRVLTDRGRSFLTLQVPFESQEGIRWSLGLAVPLDEVGHAARTQKRLLLLVMFATLGIVVWRSSVLAHRFGAPLVAMAEAARGLASGETPHLAPTSVTELAALGSMLETAAEAIRTRGQLERQVEQSQRLETVGTLAGGVAHDVNNQLLAIQGQLDLARSDLPPEHPTQGRLGKAEEAIQRCAQMVKSLLAFTHQAKPELRPMDLNDVVRESAALMERVLGGRIQVRCDLSPEPAAILGEPVQMEQVLLNLGVNARDAMPQGGLLTLRTRTRPDAWVELEVVDTGQGIPEESLPHIFEPFYTTKDVGKGTGLGLSMVFGIVKSHQGTIAVESHPGAGTAFRIALPGTQAFSTAERVRLLEPPAPLPAQGLRVLVVDDEPAIRDILAEALGGMDLQVATAADGEEAWSQFQAGTFDLVISDQRMPLCTGTELLARIRKSGSEVPFILSSGHGLEGIEAEMEQDPHVRILPKPFQIRQMMALVTTLAQPGQAPQA